MLRRYFAWARQRKLILIDPARPLRPGPQPGFTGTVLEAGTQRLLLRRWNSRDTHPHERMTGLLALLHAASSAEIRSLAAAGIDDRNKAITLPGRPFPVPADPATWDAVQACLRHRDHLATLNPHVIVTKATRTGDAPADGSYLTRLLAPAGVTPSACRQTRIAAWSATSPTTSTRTASSGFRRADKPGRCRRHLAHLPANLCELDKEGAAPTFKKGYGLLTELRKVFSQIIGCSVGVLVTVPARGRRRAVPGRGGASGPAGGLAAGDG